MRRKLLSTIGYDAEGRLVSIQDAQKGEIYHCPQCGERIVPHNSGNARKGSKRPHFAHLKKSKLKCNAESILRQLFKTQAIQLLQQHLDSKDAFHIHWACNYCSQIYTRNLLKRTASIATDYSLDGHTPDIALMDKHGQCIVALEIIVRNKLSRKIIHQYEEQGIVLVQLHIGENDLFDVSGKLQHPNQVGFCSNHECYNSQFYHQTIRRRIFTQLLKCKTCGKVMDGYMVKSDSAFGSIQLEKLNEAEKKEIVRMHFRGKKAIAADFVVFGKCKCTPYSKSLQYVKKTS